MSCDQALRLSSTLLASASFIGLASAAHSPVWLSSLTATVLILVLLQTLGGASIGRLTAALTLSTNTWNVILVLAFLGFWVDLILISGELLPAGIRFLVILMVIKLLNLQGRRDYVHLYAISLMAILAAAALTSDLWYFPVFVAYLCAGVWTLLLFQMTRHVEDSAATSGQTLAHQPSQITPQQFWLANGLAIGTLGCTLVLFFSIPRISAGLLQTGYGETIRTSGFSDRVDLGSIGPIKRDLSIVMRVEIPDQPAARPTSLYLRGVAYDHYDGQSWANQLPHRRVMYETAPMTFTISLQRGRKAERPLPLLHQNILLEPLDTAVLFGAPFAETVTGRFLTLQTDAAGALYLPFFTQTRIEYSVLSRPNPFLEADRQPATVDYHESFRTHFLQAPAQSKKIAELAREITQGIDVPYDQALAIQKYLLQHFHYSLDVPATVQAHPLEDFLFTTRTGYCEHYATAMAMLLRAIGIPTRLVTGFLATEWNEYGNYFLVRQQDAHAWVEIHLPRSGWVMMDPTPAVSEASAVPGWHALGRIMDALRLRWNRVFIQYSAVDQLAVVREVTTGGASARNRAWDSLSGVFSRISEGLSTFTQSLRDGQGLSVVQILGLPLIGLGILGWRILTRRWRAEIHPSSARVQEEAIISVYKTMIRHLAGAGISKPAATPPFQFLHTIHREWNEVGATVATITELYCRARFGRGVLTDHELRLAKRHLRHLMSLERHHRASSS
jgi:protein-glutamine gamma-glutamyltransferase